MSRNNLRILEGLAIGFGLLALATVLLWLVSCSARTTGVDVSKEQQTTTTGEAEGTMGPVYAGPYSPTTQTTIGTIALGSGWLWAPVGLLGAFLSYIIRCRGVAVRRQVGAISGLQELAETVLRTAEGHPGGRDSSVEAANIQDGLERRIELASNSWWCSLKIASRWRRDGAERCIHRSVKRLKKRK